MTCLISRLVSISGPSNYPSQDHTKVEPPCRHLSPYILPTYTTTTGTPSSLALFLSPLVTTWSDVKVGMFLYVFSFSNYYFQVDFKSRLAGMHIKAAF